MSDKTFNPQEHLTNLKGKDYLEVKWRLVWVREVHPDATITTELIEHDRQAQWAMFRAHVSIPGAGAASGHGSESARDFGDYIEKAETKAIGRALGALGFGTQFSAHEFGGEADADRPVDAPVTHSAGSGATLPPRDRSTSTNTVPDQQAPLDPTAATPRQLKFIQAIAREYGLTDEQVNAAARKHYGKDVSALSRVEASGMIQRIQAMRTATA